MNFPTLILYMTNLIKSSIQTELDSFFQLLNKASTPVREITKSAFSQARAKLDHHAFQELSQHVIQFFESHFPLRTWHGFRLLAIDSTMITLPTNADLIEHFDQMPTYTHHKRPQARASQLFDLLNRLTLHASIAPHETDERTLALEHGPYLSHRDLVLLDRGYPAFWVFAWLLSESSHFCARVSRQSWASVKAFYQSGCAERIITIQPTEPSRQLCRQYGLPLIPIRIRLIRVPIDNGEDQVLMTSLLDSDSFPASLFGDLYHQRWGIEENYKQMKSRIEIENFTGKTVHSIYQDFHARIFSANLTAVLVHAAQDLLEQDKVHSPNSYRVNFTYALSCMKNTIVRLLLNARPYKYCLQLIQLFRSTIEPVRPHRKFPRNTIRRDHRLHFQCYKRTA